MLPPAACARRFIVFAFGMAAIWTFVLGFFILTVPGLIWVRGGHVGWAGLEGRQGSRAQGPGRAALHRKPCAV